MHSLVVNFKDGKVNFEAHSVGLELINALENLGARNWYDADVGTVADLRKKCDVRFLLWTFDDLP